MLPEDRSMMTLIRDNSKWIALFIGWAAGCIIVSRRKGLAGLRNEAQSAFLAMALSLLSVLSAMLFASFEGVLGGSPGFGAISLYGCFFFCPVFLWIGAKAFKRDYGSVMDLYAVYAVPSMFLMRCNCLISGCCSGRQIPGTALHWPTREAELVFYAAVMAVLHKREARGYSKGTQFPLLTALYGAFRFVNEWVRVSDSGTWLHMAHLWSVIAAFAGYSLYTELNKNKRISILR